MLREAFLTPLHSLTLLDFCVFVAVLIALSMVIEGCGWVYRMVVGHEDEKTI